ncbi:MAG: hypothetical protein ACRD82_01400, partial [Blastocatellia bacterium]
GANRAARKEVNGFHIDIKKKILSHEATRRITKSRQDSQDWYQDLQDDLLFDDLGNPEKNPVHPVEKLRVIFVRLRGQVFS